jgi:DNA topoisomerase-1
VRGELVTFDYRGKSGQRHVRELRDARVAALVRRLLRTPGRDVFKFVEEGEIVDVRRRHVNAYVRAVSGAPFTAKDFRTWAGTVLCASELARALGRDGAPCGRRVANAAVKEVARRLGNTPAVARASYVSPAVLEAFARRRGIGCSLAPDDVIGSAPRGGLHPAERALAAFLRGAGEGSSRGPSLRVVRGGSRGGERSAGPTGATAKPQRRAARSAEAE